MPFVRIQVLEFPPQWFKRFRGSMRLVFEHDGAACVCFGLFAFFLVMVLLLWTIIILRRYCVLRVAGGCGKW